MLGYPLRVRIFDSGGSVTFTNPLNLSNCGIEDVTLELGKGFHLQVSSRP